MKWRRGVGEGQVQDRRGQGGRRGGLAVGGGLGGLGIIGAIVALLLGGLGGGGGGGGGGFDVGPGLGGFGQAQAPEEGPPPTDDAGEFVQFVVSNVQGTWEQLFAESGQQYQATELVLFEGSTQSGCGGATSQIGPHYCPTDGLVYIDLGFFDELSTRFGASGGDFAQAYVIAHEFGHHIQNVLGISDDVRQQQQGDPDAANELSVLLELQADCFAGVWGSSAQEQQLLERGDLEEGLSAASAVGDDRIQERATGNINPETWTHGSSESRVAWFLEGFETGDPGRCNTFDQGTEP